MAKKKATKKTRASYLREVEIRFKKRRIRDGSPTGVPLTDPECIAELFADMQNEGKEKLIAISVDVKLRIIAFEVVSIGSPTAVYAQPGECTRTPVMVGASGMAMVHNHPSGDPLPSDPDKDFTLQLMVACESLGIPLHDHVIIGDGDFFSFANEGLIDRYRSDIQEKMGELKKTAKKSRKN